MSTKRCAFTKESAVADSVPRKKTSKTNKNIELAHAAALNLQYVDGSFKKEVSQAFKEHKHKEIGDNGAVVHGEPFTCVKLPQFVQDTKFLEGLKDELLQLIFYDKSNDLYKFEQSDDLKKSASPHIAALRKLLYVDFLAWLKDVTGIQLSDKVDMTCAKYDYTDVLLCHDDELEDRRIAFILYLVPPWSKDDGGSLDLFDVNENGQPRNIVKSLVPQNNNFVFFEVTPVSFHQVAEVLCQDKTRLSVSGWFHGPPVDRPQPYVQPPDPLKTAEIVGEDKLFEWVNPTYMDVLIQAQIQEKFSEDSEIELQNFLQEEKYLAVAAAVKENAIKWQHRGPANKRNYERAEQDSLPEIIKECVKVLQSDEMFLLLSNFTGLKLHELAPESDSDEGDEEGEETKEGEKAKEREEVKNEDKERKGKGKREIHPRCRSDVRQWKHGSYTLLHDTDTEGSEYALDAMLFLNCTGWESDCGGYVSYLAKGEDEELLCVSPADNSLALVYRDKETLRFVKHVNHRISNMADNALEPDTAGFFDISSVYYE
ncbi:prolyl 3-hydroxylase OGFOD1-like [Ptychodera flava]|uniref:prolyl 3-hydroxylase OGFOD1-like n=1 Tax=Ptychodera flava TaxID=63121 RepID=UPI00396A8025